MDLRFPSYHGICYSAAFRPGRRLLAWIGQNKHDAVKACPHRHFQQHYQQRLGQPGDAR
jgi:hypothetical protein